MAAEKTELVCFAGPLDGRVVDVTGETFPDGQGGKYLKRSFRCNARNRNIMIHDSVDCGQLKSGVICKAITSADAD
jgi:hypothetical protein